MPVSPRYCAVCGVKIDTLDEEYGAVRRKDNAYWCPECLDQAPPDAISTAEETKPKAVRAMARPPRTDAPEPRKERPSNPFPLLLVGLLAIATFGVAAMKMGVAPPPPPPPRLTPAPIPPVETGPHDPDQTAEDGATRPATLEQAPEPSQASDPVRAPAVVASSSSGKFHRPTCKYGRKISEKNRLVFPDRYEAVGNGLSPAGCCRP